MPLTILSDSDVRKLLLQVTKEDIHDLQSNLADALHYYSTSTEEDLNGCCSLLQPLRTALKRNDRQTTLFMPASSNDGLGVKIVTLSEPGSQEENVLSGKFLASLDSPSLSQTPSTSSPTAFDVTPTSKQNSQGTTPKGSITLLDKSGAPRALINAEELTAFRTALASTILFKKRTNVHDVVVFGAGKQAYWHIKLALLLRGPEIHHLNIVNRSFETAHYLVERLYNNPYDEPTNDLARPKIQILTPSYNEYERLLKSAVRSADVIFCTTPSLAPLFPAPYLTNTEGRKKGRYIAAIGSYKPHMVELDPSILVQNVASDHEHHHHKHARTGGAIVVDSIEACMKEAGEIIQARLTGHELVEIGELLMLKREADNQRRDNISSDENLDKAGVELSEAKKFKGRKKEKGEDNRSGDGSLTAWLQKGTVIYKSVGLGLMDVQVGMDVVRLADDRGIGTRIEDF